jgi:hypothetical protein
MCDIKIKNLAQANPGERRKIGFSLQFSSKIQ